MNREEFERFAVDTLRREIPEELRWLPLGEAPQQRWADDDGGVEGRIVRGWIVAAVERGDPTPDDVTWARSRLLAEETRERLAEWLFEEWVRHDTDEPEAPTEARLAELRELAEKAAELSRRFGRPGGDQDERFTQLIEQEGRRAPASALPFQGLLAIVATGGTARVVARANAYLESCAEDRTVQCSAVRAMLSAMSR